MLVCPMKSAPVMLTLSDSKHVVLPVDDDSDLNVVASFDRRGEYIYTGNAKGKVSPAPRPPEGIASWKGQGQGLGMPREGLGSLFPEGFLEVALSAQGGDWGTRRGLGDRDRDGFGDEGWVWG